nr:MAG TPA: Membrane-bound lytic murein transglycosylase [Ackermannviridae sp.]DAM68017.1 MAG TPA: glycosyltransferase [Ackermannviridae sp.]
MMRNYKKLFLMVLFAILSTTTVNAQTCSHGFDWSRLIAAMIHIESKGQNNARNGKSLGVLQITPSAVAECNNILKKKKIKKRYTLEDRRDPQKSKEIFIHLQEHFNPEHSFEKATKCWNHGFYVKNIKSLPNTYYHKVMKQMSKM